MAWAIRANRFARIVLRESFAIDTPIFMARQADSPESLEFPIRANHATKFKNNSEQHFPEMEMVTLEKVFCIKRTEMVSLQRVMPLLSMTCEVRNGN